MEVGGGDSVPSPGEGVFPGSPQLVGADAAGPVGSSEGALYSGRGVEQGGASHGCGCD